MKVTPENISIAGDEETLAELNGELSLTDMISVEGVSESFTSDTINLADYLKENYKDKLKEIKLIDLEKDGILSNLSGKYKNKSVYVQYVGNYYCCCADKDGKSCNQDVCKGTVTP